MSAFLPRHLLANRNLAEQGERMCTDYLSHGLVFQQGVFWERDIGEHPQCTFTMHNAHSFTCTMDWYSLFSHLIPMHACVHRPLVTLKSHGNKVSHDSGDSLFQFNMRSMNLCWIFGMPQHVPRNPSLICSHKNRFLETINDIWNSL